MTACPQLIFGHHGFERDVAEDVVVHRDVLKPSENRWDWLGTGAYYWEGAPERAKDWAKRHCREPAVLGAVIDLGKCMEGGNCGDTPRRGAYQLTVSIQKDRRLDGMQWRKG